MAVFSGVWPFVKQILTGQAVLADTTPDRQTKKLRILGLLGEFVSILHQFENFTFQNYDV